MAQKLGFGTVSPDAVKPSATKAFTRWLFGGMDPMDQARAVDMDLEARRQAAAMRQAFISKLQGVAGGGPPPGAPLRAEAAPAPLPEITASPLERGADDLAGRLGRESFGDDVPTLAKAGPRIDMTLPDVPKLDGGNVPMRRAGAPSLRDNADWLLPALVMGVPGAKEAVDFIDKTGPKISNFNGFAIDERDPGNVGRFFGEAPTKGSKPAFDESGRQIGWVLENGTIQAISQTREAEERGKTRGSLIEVPMRDGTTRMMTGADFLDSRGGSGGEAAAADGFGVKQSPGEQTYDTDAAKAQVERDFTRPKAEAALSAMEAKDKIVGDAVSRALERVSGWTTGMGSILSNIPGTPAKDLQADLETIKANLGFDELQTMRDNSPTGGALGQVAVQELEALRSTLASLDQAQSPEAVRAALERIVEIRNGAAMRRREAFGRTYNAPLKKAPLSITPEQARAELARRRAAKGQ